jgi:hypothetical protein
VPPRGKKVERYWMPPTRYATPSVLPSSSTRNDGLTEMETVSFSFECSRTYESCAIFSTDSAVTTITGRTKKLLVRGCGDRVTMPVGMSRRVPKLKIVFTVMPTEHKQLLVSR